jgi:hypothetical protein
MAAIKSGQQFFLKSGNEFSALRRFNSQVTYVSLYQLVAFFRLFTSKQADFGADQLITEFHFLRSHCIPFLPHRLH